MSLRTRLLLSSLVIAVPLAISLFLIDERLRLSSMEESLHQFVNAELATGIAERCEADPVHLGAAPRGRGGRGGPPPGVRHPSDPNGPPLRPQGESAGRGQAYELFAYSPDGRPASADAPPLPAASASPSTTFWSSGGRGVEIAVSLGGSGPCATLLARMRPREGELRDQMVAFGLILFSLAGGAWFAAGPAQAREDMLRHFVANTTHDVAVPLTVLQGHLAELDVQLAPGAALREHTRAAMQEAHYMASLLRNLAVATKLGDASAPTQLGPVDLAALVERVVARQQPIARGSGVELNFAVPDPPPMATADLTLLEQALSNLTDNAIRYNRPGGAGGHVAVVLDRAGDRFVLSVTDDGPGVSESELSRLTTRWFRGSEARTRRPDGSGLGLAIASEAVARLGFALAFRRPDDGGLTAEISGRIR